MKTGENMHETWTLQSTDFPRTKEYSPKAQNHKTEPQHQTKQVDWASTQPGEGTREESSPGESRPVRPNHPSGFGRTDRWAPLAHLSLAVCHRRLEVGSTCN